MKYFFIVMIAIPALLFAQESEVPSQQLLLDTETISYTEEVPFDGGVLFYTTVSDEESVLVASAHDTNADDEYDVWLQYVNDQVVLEAYDTNNDAQPDTFMSLLDNGEIDAISGLAQADLVATTTKQFLPRVTKASDSVDKVGLVGDLSDISIEEDDYSWMLFVLLLLAAGGMYFFWKRQSD
jgi:hypothetical protein